ncbi:hypothetical protein [Pseudomonas asplenii]|uniref:hypothetical protein n=1 Tax=Pseudomonas asplenii TaxID=53407 RepID=UPI0012F9E9ED|nr:hypothetical protein [Pseudomonas fuscovaginae]
MKITQTDNSYNYTSQPTKAPQKTPEKNAITTAPPSVSISGYALLITHIYNGEPNPCFETKFDTDKSDKYYLTQADRDLLARIYEFAQEQGASPKHVTSLAWDLADYRKYQNGRMMGNLNSGHMYDNDGHRLSYSFVAKDAATADRVLKGEAIKGSLLDQDFIRYTTDPGLGTHHFSDFDFLEKVITRFSSTGDPDVKLPPQFQNYERKKGYIEHKSKEILNPTVLERMAKKQQASTAENSTTPSTAPDTKTTETLKDVWHRALLQMMRKGGWQSSLATFLSGNRNH